MNCNEEEIYYRNTSTENFNELSEPFHSGETTYFDELLADENGKNIWERLIGRQELSERISFTVDTIAVWDCTKRYDLKPQKIGNFIFYRLGHIYRLFEMTNPDDRLLSRKAAAKFLHYEPNTLAVWLCKNRHELPCVNLGRNVRYRLSDLETFRYRKMCPF